MVSLAHFLARQSFKCNVGIIRCSGGSMGHSFPLYKNYEEKVHVIPHRNFSYGFLANLPTTFFTKVAESDVSAHIRDLLLEFHSLTGLPWWCTITLSALSLRVLGFPLKVYERHLSKKLYMVKDEMEEKGKIILTEIKQKQIKHLWTPTKAKHAFQIEMLREKKNLIEKYNCHPFKAVLLHYFELPLWFVLVITWRTMTYGFSSDITSSNILMSQMEIEGPFWSQNLTQRDETYILPVFNLLGHTVLTELSILKATTKGKFFKVGVILSRGFAVIAFLVSAISPSSVSLFWASSILVLIIRDLLLSSKKFREIFKIPSLKDDRTFKEIVEASKKRWWWIGKYGKS